MISGSVFVIVRSANERTTDLCEKLIFEQNIPKECISIVNETPFSAALHKSFELGISAGLKWTLCIDADVLLRSNAINDLIKIAEKEPNNVCEIQGLVLDKFFGGPRPAGNHLYRTSLLHLAKDCIPKEGTDIRPETYLLNRMAEKGYPWKNHSIIVGLHDFEQYNQDIFRKCFVQGQKHVEHLGLFVKYWKRMSNYDNDYVVAFKGLLEGVSYNEEVYIDKKQAIYTETFAKSGTIEKSQILISDYQLSQVDSIIENWEYPEEYVKAFPTYGGLITLKEQSFQKADKLNLIFSLVYKGMWYLNNLIFKGLRYLESNAK